MSTTGSRLFVAVVPPPEAVAHLDAAVTRDGALRWVPADRWHLTLEFIGDADPAAAIHTWADRTRGVTAMRVRLAGAGAFPRTRHGRVLWVGLTGDLDHWPRLAADEQQPHLTIARSRHPVDLREQVAALAGYTGPEWTAREVVLFDSHLGRGTDGGPAYDVVHRFPFASEP